MSYKHRETLFIFFDESGNFDFSPRGTRYWSLAAICTFHPAAGREAFLDLSYDLADEGKGQQCFHATEDSQAIRDRVFQLITNLPKDFQVHYSGAEKRKVPPALRQSDVESYAYMCKRMLRYLIALDRYKPAKRLVIIFSAIFNNTRHEKLAAEIKAEIKDAIKIPCWIYFSGTKHDVNSQIADYCCWAISIKWSRNEMRSYELLKNRIASERQLFEESGINYY